MKTPEQYAEVVLEAIRENLDPETHQITGANLGLALHRLTPELDWKSYGFRNLLSLLRSSLIGDRVSITHHATGVVSIGLNDRPLEAPQLHTRPSYNPLRKQMWTAFIAPLPAGRRFFDKRTGAVKLGLQGPPNPADEWAEIEPLSLDIQKQWAEHFLKEESLLPEDFKNDIDSPRWPHSFTDALQAINGSLRFRWNRLRSSKVSKAIEQWCSKHGIPTDLVFQVEVAETHRQNRSHQVVSSIGGRRNVDVQRQIVLAALAKLPTESLLKLRLPVGLLLDTVADYPHAGDR